MTWFAPHLDQAIPALFSFDHLVQERGDIAEHQRRTQRQDKSGIIITKKIIHPSDCQEWKRNISTKLAADIGAVRPA